MSSLNESTDLFLKLKHEIASSYPDFQDNITRSWKEIIEELGRIAETVSAKGSEVCMHMSW